MNRPLGRWIVGAQRLDRVADELEPDRLRVARRVDIENAAADREFAVLVSRVLAGKAGFDKQLSEVGWCDVLGRRSTDAFSRRAGGLTRGRMAAADATTTRADPLDSPYSARARSEVTPT